MPPFPCLGCLWGNDLVSFWYRQSKEENNKINKDSPELASNIVFCLQNGQLYCLLFCMTIKHRMQNVWLQLSLTGRH